MPRVDDGEKGIVEEEPPERIGVLPAPGAGGGDCQIESRLPPCALVLLDVLPGVMELGVAEACCDRICNARLAAEPPRGDAREAL